MRVVAFTSEDTFFTFFRIARHVVLFRPCHELSHKVSRRITLITNRRHCHKKSLGHSKIYFVDNARLRFLGWFPCYRPSSYRGDYYRKFAVA